MSSRFWNFMWIKPYYGHFLFILLNIFILKASSVGQLKYIYLYLVLCVCVCVFDYIQTHTHIHLVIFFLFLSFYFLFLFIFSLFFKILIILFVGLPGMLLSFLNFFVLLHPSLWKLSHFNHLDKLFIYFKCSFMFNFQVPHFFFPTITI